MTTACILGERIEIDETFDLTFGDDRIPHDRLKYCIVDRRA